MFLSFPQAYLFGGVPRLTVDPSISGTAHIGQQLSGADGVYSGSGVTVGSYQWQRSDIRAETGWADISGATSANYTAVAADAQRYLRRGEVASNAHGSAARAYSAASGKILGLAFVGGVIDPTSPHNSAATWTQSLSSLTGGIASSPSVGDLIIAANAVVTAGIDVAMSCSGNSSGSYTAAATELYVDDSRDLNLAVHYKIAGSTPDTELTLAGYSDSGAAALAAVFVIRGANSSTPMDAAAQTSSATSSAQPDPAAITPSTSGAWVVVAAASTAAWNATAVHTTSSGYGNTVYDMTDSESTTRKPRVGIQSKAWSGSGAENPAQWTVSDTSTSDACGAFTLAVRPEQ